MPSVALQALAATKTGYPLNFSASPVLRPFTAHFCGRALRDALLDVPMLIWGLYRLGFGKRDDVVGQPEGSSPYAASFQHVTVMGC